MRRRANLVSVLTTCANDLLARSPFRKSEAPAGDVTMEVDGEGDIEGETKEQKKARKEAKKQVRDASSPSSP